MVELAFDEYYSLIYENTYINPPLSGVDIPVELQPDDILLIFGGANGSYSFTDAPHFDIIPQKTPSYDLPHPEVIVKSHLGWYGQTCFGLWRVLDTGDYKVEFDCYSPDWVRGVLMRVYRPTDPIPFPALHWDDQAHNHLMGPSSSKTSIHHFTLFRDLVCVVMVSDYTGLVVPDIEIYAINSDTNEEILLDIEPTHDLMVDPGPYGVRVLLYEDIPQPHGCYYSWVYRVGPTDGFRYLTDWTFKLYYDPETPLVPGQRRTYLVEI